MDSEVSVAPGNYLCGPVASRIASLASRSPRAILTASTIAAVLLVLLAGKVPGMLELGGAPPSGSDSAQVDSALTSALGYEAEPAYKVLLEGNEPINSASSAVAIRTVRSEIQSIDGVGAVTESAPGPGAQATTLAVHLDTGLSESRVLDIGDELRGSLDPGTLRLQVAGGVAVAEGARSAALDQAPALLLIVVPLLLLILAGTLGPRAALTALLGAVLAAGAAICLLGLIDLFASLEAIAVPVAGFLAAVLAVESGAALLHRYREEAATLGGGAEALEYSLHIVLKGVAIAAFSAALIGGALLVVPLDWARSIGAGVLAAAVIAPPLALLPMSATLAGRAGSEVGTALPLVSDDDKPERGSLAFRWLFALGRGRSRALVAVVPLLIIAALCLPLRDNAEAVGLSGTELPADESAAIAEAALAGALGPGASSPFLVVTDGPAEAPTVTIYRDEASKVEGVSAVGLATTVGDLATFQVQPTDPPPSLAARNTLDQLAAVGSPSPRMIGGLTASLSDAADRVSKDGPLALLVALLGTAALWSLLFRSSFGPLLALCAAIAPLAGIAAMIGVFGFGRLTGTLDYAGTGGVHLQSYLVVGAVLLAIGLARGAQMATALREERMLGGGAAGSLARAGLLTLQPAASATIVGFALSVAWIRADLLPAQEIGLGLAAGLLADLILTRLILAPAAARLAI